MSTPKDVEDAISSEKPVINASLSTSSSSSSQDSLPENFRKRFHAEMEDLMELYNVEMLVEKNQRIDDQLVYRLQCALHGSIDEKPAAAVMALDLWCYEECKPGYIVGYRIESENDHENERSFFEDRIGGSRSRIDSVEGLLKDFYLFMEQTHWHPDQRLFSRDFAYPINNALHFSHRSEILRASAPPTENYEARVVYPYESSMEGELSVEAAEVLLVLKNLGNGWVFARQRSQTGLVPENYIQRIFKKD